MNGDCELRPRFHPDFRLQASRKEKRSFVERENLILRASIYLSFFLSFFSCSFCIARVSR